MRWRDPGSPPRRVTSHLRRVTDRPRRVTNFPWTFRTFIRAESSLDERGRHSTRVGRAVKVLRADVDDERTCCTTVPPHRGATRHRGSMTITCSNRPVIRINTADGGRDQGRARDPAAHTPCSAIEAPPNCGASGSRGSPASRSRRRLAKPVRGTPRRCNAGRSPLHRRRTDPSEVTELHGIRVTSLARTWIDLVSIGSDLYDAVAAGDCALRLGARRSDLLAQSAVRGLRGVRRARAGHRSSRSPVSFPPRSRSAYRSEQPSCCPGSRHRR